MQAYIDEHDILVNPLVDETKLKGLLILGRKTGRGAVYTLEDADLVRSLSTHMALSVERLEHIEREKELIRTTAESQLTALRAQINPHFLFNTLNAIASLIDEKPEEAERTVEQAAALPWYQRLFDPDPHRKCSQTRDFEETRGRPDPYRSNSGRSLKIQG